MREERLAIGGAVIAALAASLCCLGPLLFLVLGLGVFSAAAVFEAAPPYLIGAAVLRFWLLPRLLSASCLRAG